MKKLEKILGLPLVYTGVTLLALSYVTGLSRVNAILFTSLFLVLAGAATYVWKIRKQSPYS